MEGKEASPSKPLKLSSLTQTMQTSLFHPSLSFHSFLSPYRHVLVPRKLRTRTPTGTRNTALFSFLSSCPLIPYAPHSYISPQSQCTITKLITRTPPLLLPLVYFLLLMFFSSYALPSFLFDSPLLPTSRNNPTSKLNSRSRYTLSSLSPSFSSIFVVYVPVIVTRTRRVARNQDIDRKTKDRLDSHQAGLSVPFFPSLPSLL